MAAKKKAAPRKRPRRPVKSRRAADVMPRPQFDGRSFLTSVGTGRTSTAFQSKKFVYRQGDPADAVYYIQAGKIQLTVVSEQGKEGVIAMLGTGNFLAKGALPGNLFGWRQPPPW